MNAILLTAFVGLVLATLFLVLFLYQLENRKFSSNERESLMPLQDEQVRPAISKHEPHAENSSDRS
jgi:hypothetical protein